MTCRKPDGRSSALGLQNFLIWKQHSCGGDIQLKHTRSCVFRITLNTPHPTLIQNSEVPPIDICIIVDRKRKKKCHCLVDYNVCSEVKKVRKEKETISTVHSMWAYNKVISVIFLHILLSIKSKEDPSLTTTAAFIVTNYSIQ